METEAIGRSNLKGKRKAEESRRLEKKNKQVVEQRKNLTHSCSGRVKSNPFRRSSNKDQQRIQSGNEKERSQTET